MKTNAFLFLAALGLVLSTRSLAAAQPRLEAEVIVLPTFVVTVPRYQPFEKQMQTNLNEIRQQAHTPVTATLALLLSQSQSHEQKVALKVASTKAARPGSKS